MAKRKPARKKPKTVDRRKKVARKKPKTVARKKNVARKAPARRRPAPKPPSSRKAAPPKFRPGTITHTELASADPPATRTWCESVLGWKFGEAVPTPTGPYHMWRFDLGTGGGIRANNPPEVPGSIPYCEVADIRTTYGRALEAGATEMIPPMQLPSGMGWIAVVAAPGGVAIGLWALK